MNYFDIAMCPEEGWPKLVYRLYYPTVFKCVY